MVINTQNYDDFHRLVGNLASPAVYTSIQGSMWQGIGLSAATAVICTNYDGEPAAFAADYPGAITLDAFIYPQ